MTIALVAALAAAVYLMPGLGLRTEDSRQAAEGREYPTRGCDGARTEPREDRDAARQATLCLHNAVRADHGLSPLVEDSALRRAALQHSRAMVEQRFFDHVAPDGSDLADRLVAAGYDRRTGTGVAAENLAYGEEVEATPAAVVDGWMHSPGHRKNILRPELREIGIGIVPEAVKSTKSGRDGASYTITFGG